MTGSVRGDADRNLAMSAPITENPVTRASALVHQLDRLGPARQRDAIRAELARAGTPPDGADQGLGRPGFALSLHGIFVIGANEADAIRLWHCTARHQIGGWPEVDMDPALRLPQIQWAMWALHNQMHISRESLTNACRVIKVLSHNRILLDRARDLARAQNLTV